jgi:transposase
MASFTRFRNKEPKEKQKRKPGGQVGRTGKNLQPFENPDERVNVSVDRDSLPKDRTYRTVGFVRRQVVHLTISRKVIEYCLEILEDEKGKRYTAKAPEGASRPVQYGNSVKTHAVYLGTSQLIPCGRVGEHFRDQLGIPLSCGSIFNFYREAYDLLREKFLPIATQRLIYSSFLHSDETGININGKGHWLHATLNDRWTLFMPHKSRGKEATDHMGILPHFKGVLIHDHWGTYFRYDNFKHGLCNAHHLRELQGIMDNYPQSTWAQLMKALLLEINEEVKKAGGVLKDEVAKAYHKRYIEIMEVAEAECPLPPVDPNAPKKRGRLKKTKERNLLERLRDFQEETLRFMGEKDVDFTNNAGERDIRMTKVKQKISGCFKSFTGAEHFCLIRSYLLTAQKHGMSATQALDILFSGNLPDFCYSP